MLRKAFVIVVMGTISLGALFAAGCATNDAKPYALTGQNQTGISEGTRERYRYTDSKGRYREDLKMMGAAQRP